MSLIVLIWLQAVAAPVAFVESPSGDGGFVLTVATLPAEKLSETQDMLDAAAAKRCGTKAVVAGEQSYDQSTSSDGLPASTITHLRMTYRCA
jgi:hypothetical protein